MGKGVKEKMFCFEHRKQIKSRVITEIKGQISKGLVMKIIVRVNLTYNFKNP